MNLVASLVRITFVVMALVVFASIGSAAEPREEWSKLAAFLSGEHLDAKAIVREPYSGNRLLIKSPLPPVSPNRVKAVAGLTDFADPDARAASTGARRLVALHRCAIELIDECLTARRMDAKFMEELTAKHRRAAVGKFLAGPDEETTVEEIEKEIGKFVDRFIDPTYKIGLAQKLRAEEATALEAGLQEIWERQVIEKLTAFAGPEFDTPVVEVARTKLVNEIGVGTAVAWRGLCVTNTGKRDLSNVTVALKLTAGAENSLGRTYFFPTLKAGQTFLLYMNDRDWGEVGHTAAADKLLADILVLCDQGKQSQRTYSLPQPTARAHLARGAMSAVTEEQRQNDVNANALFRALAKQTKSLRLTAEKGSASVELQFAEPTASLVNMAGRIMVDSSRYLRITMTDAARKTIELDGHPQAGGGKVELLSHNNVNGAVEPVARRYDRNNGFLTVENGKIVLTIHKMTFRAAVADAGVDVEPVKPPKSGEGGVRRSAPGSTPSKTPSLIGEWAGTFKNGSKADFTFTRDLKFTGTNGANGTWSQSGRKVRISTKTNAAPLIWEGEISEDGMTLTATTAAGGRVTATRTK